MFHFLTSLRCVCCFVRFFLSVVGLFLSTPFAHWPLRIIDQHPTTTFQNNNGRSGLDSGRPQPIFQPKFADNWETCGKETQSEDRHGCRTKKPAGNEGATVEDLGPASDDAIELNRVVQSVAASVFLKFIKAVRLSTTTNNFRVVCPAILAKVHRPFTAASIPFVLFVGSISSHTIKLARLEITFF